MPNGKYPVVKAMKPSGYHRPPHRRVGIAEALKLPNRDNTVLPVGQSGYLLTPRQSFCVHNGNKLCRG